MNCGNALPTTPLLEAVVPEERLPLITHGRYEATLYTRCSMYGTPFAVGLVTGSDGNRYTVLTDSREFDLDHCGHIEGLDVKVTPTEKGLRMKPLTHQSDEFHAELMARLEKGPDPDKGRIPELVEEPEPPEHPAAGTDGAMVPVIGELISYVAKVAMENGLPAAGWAFIPPGPGYPSES